MTAPQIAEAIRALGSADESARSRAARILYDAGCALGLAATRAWRADPVLAALLAGQPTVGVAVEPETFDRIRAANGSPPLAKVPSEQDAREFELHFPPDVSLDVLTPRERHGKGVLSRFLDRHGEAIQQVELPVADVDRATALLRDRFSLAPVYPAARPGAGGTRMNFFLVSSGPRDKVLIELVEELPEKDPRSEKH